MLSAALLSAVLLRGALLSAVLLRGALLSAAHFHGQVVRRAGSGGSVGATATAASPTPTPATTSRTQWFAVTTTTIPVMVGYRKHSARPRRPASSADATHAVHTAQARCSDGIAAYWSAGT
ncbi:hypothetical protein GCM10010532_010760 [Dactylosporangium siamense]|uniref:Uncharacterized protein n=1 Tax=Dactylosporangium siamense TaxID=685454 RepID=A0A919PDT0_9ACTN|nr:hypothetical protein Dsi01nite_009860 [Dactylosporangium siamense]